MAPQSSFSTSNLRQTDTHIFFWGSVLSNWDQTSKFSGARALELLLPRLDMLKITYLGPEAPSTQLISKHIFNCGEQFMMACKAWIFETHPKTVVLRSILASKKPAEQKALGRKVSGFKDDIWTPASVPIVVASQIARAEVNRHLSQLYHASGTKTFVEGSPRDNIWGVGIHWMEKSIENESNWKGENRLGRCHGMAREEYLKQKQENWNDAKAERPKAENKDIECSQEESLEVVLDQQDEQEVERGVVKCFKEGSEAAPDQTAAYGESSVSSQV